MAKNNPHALYFDSSVNSYGKIANHSLFDLLPTSDFTIEQRIKCPSTIDQDIITKGYGNNQTVQYGITLDGDGKLVGIVGGQSVTIDFVPSDWTTVTLVNFDDSGTQKFYMVVNDEYMSDFEESGVQVSSDIDLLFGQRRELDNNTGFINPFYGTIDEIRIWNKQLNRHEIAKYYNKKLGGRENGLVGYYTFDEGAEDKIYNRQKNQHAVNTTATIIGDSTEWVKGEVDLKWIYQTVIRIEHDVKFDTRAIFNNDIKFYDEIHIDEMKFKLDNKIQTELKGHIQTKMVFIKMLLGKLRFV